jgi:hypothetical protein
MLKITFLLTAVWIILITDASGQSSGFGAGIMLGDPSGISLKSWLTKNSAWDAGIAWRLGEGGAFHIHADYLLHKYGFIKVEKGSLPLYYGLGARVLFADDTHIGARGVVGLDYLFAATPLDIFLEIVPLLDLVPDVDLDINGAIGIRYFF